MPGQHSPGALRCISLHQPWATLPTFINPATGNPVKMFETRGRPTNIRGRVGIAATVNTAWCGRRGTRLTIGDYEIERDASGLLLRSDRLAWPYRLPTGAIVATATIVNCLPIVERTWPQNVTQDCLSIHAPGDDEYPRMLRWTPGQNEALNISDQLPYGDYTPGRYAYELADVRPVNHRCPACWGAGVIGAVFCQTCKGKTTCHPVTVTGHQGWWWWTP